MRLIGVAAADLIIKYDPPSRGGELLKRLKVIVRRPGASMQAHERELARSFAAADESVPRLKATEWDSALHGWCFCTHDLSPFSKRLQAAHTPGYLPPRKRILSDSLQIACRRRIDSTGWQT